MKPMKQGHFHIDVIGLMSGTSLDGLDICCVSFDYDGKWNYRIIKAESEEYPDSLRDRLASAQDMCAREYALLHSDYGLYLGGRVRAFVERNGLKVDLVASHGQTVFHQPSLRFTSQIGSGAGIAAVSGIDTVCDFRTTDVALGGQGAPLVPIGDSVLFGEYDYCLNLGGFSNISFESGGKRLAYDISPVNYVLNHYASRLGYRYDRDGETARSGKVCRDLLDRLNALVGSYVNLAYPLPGGGAAKFLDDGTTYLGNQLESERGDGRCFGVLANADFILICTYGEGGADPELVLYKKR